MTIALPKHKAQIVSLLSQSFNDNKSVNYLIPQDSHRTKRLTRLMEYSFDYCQLFGKVYISDNEQACALVVYPHKVKTSLRSITLDLRLIFQCIGIANIKKALNREALIKRLHPKHPFCYLWFIGVSPDAQRKGLGTELLHSLLEQENLPIYLETSVERNIPWYEKNGFTIHQQIDLGYTLYCLKN